MRRLLVATSVLAMLALSACSSAESSSGASGGSSSGASAKGSRVGYVAGVEGDAFFATAVCGAQDAAKQESINLDVQTPSQFSPQAEVPLIEALIAKKVKALIVFPDDPVGVTATLKVAQQDGIVVHTMSADTTDKSARSFNLHQDLSLGGEVAAQELAKAIGGKGAVWVINRSPSPGPTFKREAGFKKAIAAFPGVKYLGQGFGNNDLTQSAQQVSAELQAHPEIKGIYAVNQNSGMGAVAAIKQLGLTGKVFLVLHDTAPTEVEALRSGVVYGLIGTNAYQYGYQAVEAMKTAIEGQTPSVIVPPEIFVSRANVDDPSVQKQYIYKKACG